MLTLQDLELEEFRALEQEILGDSSSHAGLRSSNSQWHTARLQQQPHIQQHQTQQQQLLQDEEAAEQQYGHQEAEQLELQQPADQQWGLDPEQHAGRPSAAASASAGAAAAAAGLPQGINLLDVKFQDDTEWVDTEFSFADLSLEAQQDQTRAAGQHRPHSQHGQRHHQQQQQFLSNGRQQEPYGAVAPTVAGSEEPLAQQPYVRSIFKQQQQQQQQGSRPASSQARLGTAGSRKGPHAGKSPPRSAGPSAAATAAAPAAGDDDAEQQMVFVPASAVARWQQLEAAQPNLQQEKAALRKMRQELEKAAQQLELQRAAWERDRVSLTECWQLLPLARPSCAPSVCTQAHCCTAQPCLSSL